MSEELPPLMLLRAFDAAGRHMSFTAAAESLGVTPSTISHQIASLENWLRVSLFFRESRRLRFTPEGAELHGSIAASFEQIRCSSQGIRNRGESARLRISANPFFASECLIPLLGELRAAFPSIHVRINGTEAIEDPRDRSVDFCIRVGGNPESGIERTLIFPVSAILIGPARAHSMERLPVVDFRYRDASIWSLCEKHLGSAWLGKERVEFSSYALAMRAVEQGVGACLGLKPIVNGWLSEGRVKRIDGYPEIPFESIYLVSRPLMRSERQLHAAREWLLRRLREQASLEGE